MQKVEQFSVYRTPFKCKFKIDSKTSPPKAIYNNFHSTTSNQKCLTNSPYSIKYSRQHQTVKVPRTAFAKQEEIQDRFTSNVRLRLKSAPHRPTKTNEVVELQKTEQQLYLNNQTKIKAKTLRQTFIRSASRKKLNLQSQFRYASNSLSQRKFTISVVSLAKQREKSRRLVDKKLEAYNYKTVLGDPLPFRTKKIPKLIINQQGIVRLERN